MTSSAASSFFCAETRDQWNYNKNLDQIIGIPNHRFIVQHGDALEKDLLANFPENQTGQFKDRMTKSVAVEVSRKRAEVGQNAMFPSLDDQTKMQEK